MPPSCPASFSKLVSSFRDRQHSENTLLSEYCTGALEKQESYTEGGFPYTRWRGTYVVVPILPTDPEEATFFPRRASRAGSGM